MSKTRVFVSFDYDHDSSLKEFLVGQSRHPDSPFEIADHSIKQAITSGDWKANARTRIRRADVVCVICGHHTHTAAGVSAELRIAQEEGTPYFLLAGYKDGTSRKPLAAKASDKIYKWSWDNLKNLIGGAR
ncbi:TIR domain-containing protein [Alcanivorax sp.]|uniref:TIR domain-containing protein n=1 Tax=Alcanivorax sp. TaxID=1872427 RepID=UPI00258FD34A|nr:TIR domain-containing protein [Alcanivorax sp.]